MNGHVISAFAFWSKLAFLGPVALATVAVALAGCRRESTSSQPPGPPLASVVVLTVHKMNLPLIAKPTGTTKALSEVVIRARVKGFLKEKFFREGQNVQKGELLLVIEEDQFKVRVEQAKAKRDIALAELDKAKQSKAREAATAQLDLDQASAELARVEERRESLLLSRNATSRENFDRQQASRKKSEAQVKVSEANLLQARSDYDVDIQAAQANLEKAQADLREAEIELGYCRMVSPIKGRIGDLKIKLGNLVGQGGTNAVDLVTVEQLDPMAVEMRVPARYLPSVTHLVKSGLKVGLRVQGRRAHPYQGTVIFLDNAVDSTTSTVLVKAEVPNPEEIVLPGEYVQLEMNVGDYVGALVVPEKAVLEEGQEGARVLVVDSQNKVASARVAPLDVVEGLRVLDPGKSQLQEGQKVVVEGVPLVRPGETVRVEADEAQIDSYRRTETESRESEDLDNPLIRLRGADRAGDNSNSTDRAPSAPKGKAEVLKK